MSWILSTLVGLGAGILASMGLGGGFVLVVYLALASSMEQRLVQGVNLLFFVPIILLAVILHLRNRLVDLRTSLICAAIGAGACVGGFYLGRALDNEILRALFAAFIILAGARDLLSKTVDK